MSEIYPPEIIKVGQLLQFDQLAIPVYQRPYKWTTKNVLQLLADISLFREKSAYRLGTLVIHDDVAQRKWNIVDGQQRYITLQLITLAVLRQKRTAVKSPELKSLLEKLAHMPIPRFSNEISIFNVKQNYRVIEKEVAGFDEDLIDFLFTKCELIKFVLSDVSSAFQFFDAQNARGKDLEPHDLLKAYHLREIPRKEADRIPAVVSTWEKVETGKLARLFGEFLYRIRGWSKGESSRLFTKASIDMFKGISLDKISAFPFTEIIKIAHYYIDRYNDSYERNIDGKNSRYPFQLDQTIVNGRRFFEMVDHYDRIYEEYRKNSSDSSRLDDMAARIMHAINDYEGRSRVGDGYVRMLFDCALIYYIDKFGYYEISKAVAKIFIWAYSLRLGYQNLQMASVDNYVLGELNLFKQIRHSNLPEEVLNQDLPPILEVYSTKTKAIQELFTSLKYYE